MGKENGDALNDNYLATIIGEVGYVGLIIHKIIVLSIVLLTYTVGKKDSNEAYSSRWILAALSDFNGQLQARDIIRFLKYAAGQNMKKPPYDDRILMPAEIRYAVPKCSNAKISDIKAEYENLKPIFEKLEDLPTDEKTLPMNLENNIFTSAEPMENTKSKIR